MPGGAHAHRHRRRRFHVHPAALGADELLYLGAVAGSPGSPSASAPLVLPAAPAAPSCTADAAATVHEELAAARAQSRHRARRGLLICLGILLLLFVHVRGGWLFGTYLWVMERLCVGQ